MTPGIIGLKIDHRFHLKADRKVVHRAGQAIVEIQAVSMDLQIIEANPDMIIGDRILQIENPVHHV